VADENERYGGNANKWRKVYGRTRKKPRVTQYFDSGSQQNVSQDLNKIYRHRDYFQVKGVRRSTIFWSLPILAAEYEEGLIAVDGDTEFTVSFGSPFSVAPIVVYTTEPNDLSSSNVNVFGTEVPTSTQMFVGLSAPFSGNVRYRAAYSPTWPAAASSAYTGSFTIEAGAIDITDATEYTASYTLASGTIEFRASFHDSLANSGSDVGLLNDSTTNTTSLNSLTAPGSGKIHFIAFKL
jgi:hypothetical protein